MTEQMQVTIPKLIMQTWKTKELPAHWQASQDSILKYHPEWKYVLMTDEDNRNFIQEHFPDFLATYDNFPYPIQRADAIRYAWLYVHGGLYLDCDFELLGPLDELFTSDANLFLLASSNTPSVITNGLMAAKPGQPLWLAMIEEMKQGPGLYSLERHLHVMHTTGPLAFSRVIHRLQVPYQLLPSAKLNPYTLCETVFDKPDTLARPLPGSSWIGPAAYFYQSCYCHPVPWILIGLLLLIGFLLWYFLLR